MKRGVVIGLLSLLPLIQAPVCAGEGEASHLNTVILNDEGVYVPSAKLYVYSLDRQQFFEVRETSATDQLILPAGRYRLYAGLTQHNNGIFEHFKSAEATVRTHPGESLSVIFALHKVIESEVTVSDSVMEKLRLEPELVNHLN